MSEKPACRYMMFVTEIGELIRLALNNKEDELTKEEIIFAKLALAFNIFALEQLQY